MARALVVLVFFLGGGVLAMASIAANRIAGLAAPTRVAVEAPSSVEAPARPTPLGVLMASSATPVAVALRAPAMPTAQRIGIGLTGGGSDGARARDTATAAGRAGAGDDRRETGQPSGQPGAPSIALSLAGDEMTVGIDAARAAINRMIGDGRLPLRGGTVQFRAPDTIAGTADVSFGGFELPLAVAVRVWAEGGRLRVATTELRSRDGSLPPELTAALARRLEEELPQLVARSLPNGAAVKAVTVRPDSVTLSLATP